MYSLVAGHIESKETALQALSREAKEEVNIDVLLKHLEVVHVMHRNCNDYERVDFFIKATDYSGEINNLEPEKCDALNWFDIENLPENTIPYIKEAIQSIMNSTYYGEHGWE